MSLKEKLKQFMQEARHNAIIRRLMFYMNFRMKYDLKYGRLKWHKK